DLGKALADGTGFEDDIRETWFAVGLQGVSADNIQAVEELIDTSIKDIIKNGISDEEVEAALHQMELDTREISGGHFPYSLNLLFRFFGPWMHGGDPVQALDFDASLQSLKEALQSPNYLTAKMQEYFVDNPHRVTLTVKPDHEQGTRETNEETAKLAAIAKNLTEEEKKAVVERGIALEKQQEEVEDLACLPNLKISDIPKTLEVCKATELNWEGLGVDFYEQPTNGIFYCHWSFSLPTLTMEEHKWLPLLGTLIPATGAGELDYAAMSRRISLHTGGFSLGVNLSKLAQSKDYRNEFSLKSKALDSKIPELFTIAKELLLHWRLDEETRIQSLVKQKSSSASNSVLASGHQYAASLAMRNLTPALQIDELQSGVSQVQFLKALSKLSSADLLKEIAPFKKLLKRIFVKENFSLFAVGSAGAWELAKTEIKGFIDSLPSGEKATNIKLDAGIKDHFQKEVWFTTTPVSYVAKSFPAPLEKDPLSPKFLVMANLMKSSFLHGEIREKGGAYGGMASFQAIEGAITFLSYRDPHVARTLKVYDRALEWVRNGNFTDENLEEAIRITMSNLDTPLSPAGKAIREKSHYQRGKKLEERQAYREGILGTTREEILEAATKWLKEPAAVATITSKDIFEAEKPEISISLVESQI
ncbi:MAG: insulinase family protein, partial [SAR324 cluster bacterium]|nr:insulinase family protein [SAR324 cluster bacterium]